jgi:hypothetical protein
LYAALLDNAPDICGEIIRAGGRLSAEEEADPAASASLQKLLAGEPGLRDAYLKVPKARTD